MTDIPTVTDGNALDADLDWNPMATKVNDHEDRLLVLEGGQNGSFTVSFASGDSTKDTAKTFGTAFTDTPTRFQITLMESTGGAFGAIATALSTTGFTIRAFTTTGVAAAAAHTVTVFWEAKP